MKKIYRASWYDPDECFDEVEGFDPYILQSSDHESIDEAKVAAVKGVVRSDFFQGWAEVQTVFEPTLRRELEYGPRYVNEIYKNKWQGWVEVGE